MWIFPLGDMSGVRDFEEGAVGNRGLHGLPDCRRIDPVVFSPDDEGRVRNFAKSWCEVFFPFWNLVDL